MNLVNSCGKALLCVIALAVAACGSGDDSGAPPKPGPSRDAGTDSRPGSDSGAGSCQINADCDTGVCNTSTRRCVECVQHSDCAPGSTCTANVCVAPPSCKTNADCASSGTGKLCDSDLGKCVQCVGAADCEPEFDCDESRRCVASKTCKNSLDCNPGQVCDDARGRCVECVRDDDCLGTRKCAGSVCRPGCNSDTDCTSLGLLCDLAGGYCVECLDHDDCATDRFCGSGGCRADVCRPGASRCEGNAVSTCSAAGSGHGSPVACLFSQTCVASGEAAACQNHVCSPLSIQCELNSERLVECAADGLSTTPIEDCALSGKVCAGTACKPVVCTPNDVFCTGDNLLRCNAKGDASTVVSTCTPSLSFCDDANDRCSSDICIAGQNVCVGNVAKTCNAAGSGYDGSGTDCTTTSQTCWQGTCQNLVCQPSTYFCKTGDVHRCAADGQSSTLYDDCLTTEYCTNGDLTCNPQLCTPGQPTCNGVYATTCNADGSGHQPGGTDCSATSKVCWLGACQTPVCQASTYFCQSGDVYLCASNALSSSLYDDCTATEYCTANDSTCNSQICSPGAAVCSGSLATTCKPDGSGPQSGGTDCAATSKVCFNGQCYTPVCTANTYFCVTGDVHRCAANGLSSSLYDDCLSTEYCTDGDSTCNFQICTPNAAVCNGTLATTCKPDGSGYQTGGTDCALTGKVCSQGVCQTPICTANAYFCQSGDVYVCSANGLTSTLIDDCVSGEFCTAGDPTCNPQICTPNQLACNGNTVATCNSDGSGYNAGGTNCAPQYCVGAACTPTILVETFEDGDFAGWTAGAPAQHTISVVNTVAANGTTRSLSLVKPASAFSGNYDGLYRTFSSPAQPATISWWAYPLQTNGIALYFIAGQDTGTSYAAFYHYFNSNGQMTLASGSNTVVQTYSANTWYHLEVKNINWTNRTFDYYVNGVLRGAALAFYAATGSPGIRRVDLFNYTYSTSGYFDEIELK